ncbi:MAG: hypothetical protein DWH86_02925 [Planctomycetota bacterium]|nr:MAG: hypothetical protein DWH86_02925 [Planctomycetota bacterium]
MLLNSVKFPSSARIAAIAGAIFLAAVSSPVHAQADALPPDLVNVNQALTAEQRNVVTDFITKAADRFTKADPAGVVVIRTKLVEQIRLPTVSANFRRDFGIAFVKGFAPFTQGTDSMRATNAFILARFIDTAECIDFLVDNLDPDIQPEAVIRIAAAAQLPKALDKAPLSAPQYDAITKRLATVIKKERDWVVASHEVESITLMLSKETLTASQADAIAMSLATSINDLQSRVAAGSDPQLINALQRALLAVRNQLSGIAGSARTKLLTAIAPSLESLVKMKSAPPAGITGTELTTTFNAVVNTAGLLQKVRASGGV